MRRRARLGLWLGGGRGAGVEGFLEAVEGHGRRRWCSGGPCRGRKDTVAKAAILVWEENFLVDLWPCLVGQIWRRPLCGTVAFLFLFGKNCPNID
jgi:hypothetical protein